MMSACSSWSERTLVQLKVRDSLPLVSCDEPLVVLLSTTEVDDKLRLVIAENFEDSLEAVDGKDGVGEEIRRYDHLLQTNQCP
jgi:hypothetical protein